MNVASPICDNDFWSGLSFCTMHSGTAPWPSDVETWLTPRERRELICFRSPSRRADWLRGRWCGKRLLGHRANRFSSPQDWEILSRKSTDRGCRPEVFLNGERQTGCLSISHNPSLTLAAFVTRADQRIGVDVVDDGPLPESFATTWFTEDERARLQDNEWSGAIAWAAKEAAFKACNEGESFRPRTMRIGELSPNRCRVHYPNHQYVEVQFTPIDNAWIALARSPNRKYFRAPQFKDAS